MGASTFTSDADPTILCVLGNFKPRLFSKLHSDVKPPPLAFDESVILSKIFFPVYVPSVAAPLVGAALTNEAANGMKNGSKPPF